MQLFTGNNAARRQFFPRKTVQTRVFSGGLFLMDCKTKPPIAPRVGCTSGVGSIIHLSRSTSYTSARCRRGRDRCGRVCAAAQACHKVQRRFYLFLPGWALVFSQLITFALWSYSFTIGKRTDKVVLINFVRKWGSDHDGEPAISAVSRHPHTFKGKAATPYHPRHWDMRRHPDRSGCLLLVCGNAYLRLPQPPKPCWVPVPRLSHTPSLLASA